MHNIADHLRSVFQTIFQKKIKNPNYNKKEWNYALSYTMI